MLTMYYHFKIFQVLNITIALHFVISIVVCYRYPTTTTSKNMLRITSRQVEQEEHGPLELHNSNHYKHIPLNNSRIIQLINWNHMKQGSKTKTKNEFRNKILQKATPIIEDLETVKELELKLLEFGVYAVCSWENKLPPPLDEDHQCSETELKYLIDNYKSDPQLVPFI